MILNTEDRIAEACSQNLSVADLPQILEEIRIQVKDSGLAKEDVEDAINRCAVKTRLVSRQHLLFRN